MTPTVQLSVLPRQETFAIAAFHAIPSLGVNCYPNSCPYCTQACLPASYQLLTLNVVAAFYAPIKKQI